MTSGPAPCRVVYVRTTPSRSASRADPASGERRCRTSSSTRWCTGASRTTRRAAPPARPRRRRSRAQQPRQRTSDRRRSAPSAPKAVNASTHVVDRRRVERPELRGQAVAHGRPAGGAARAGDRHVADPGGVGVAPARTPWSRPTPMPHEPCRPAPRRRSRTRLAARWYGVASSAVGVDGEQGERVRDAEPRPGGRPRRPARAGRPPRSRDRWVGTPCEGARAELGEGVVPAVRR